MRPIDPPKGFSTLIEWHQKMGSPQVWSKEGYPEVPCGLAEEAAARTEFDGFRPFFRHKPDPKGKDIWQRCRLVKVGDEWFLFGDCEDGELDLQVWFVSAGVPRGALTFAVVERSGQGHCVTIMNRLRAGDQVFDLLDEKPWDIEDYPYPIIARQIPGRDDKWEDLRSEPTLEKVTVEARIAHLEKVNDGFFKSIRALRDRVNELERAVDGVTIATGR